MEFQIKTSGLGQKSGVFSINEQRIRFRDHEIKTPQVKSVATSMRYSGNSVAYNLSVKIWIRTEFDSLKLSFTGSDSLFSKSVEETALNFISIRKALIDYTAPHILNRLIEQFKCGGEIVIGNFYISRKGVSYNNTFTGLTRANWDDDIEIRQNGDDSVHKKVLEFFTSTNQNSCDQWSVFFRNKYTGKIVRLGNFSFEDENGYFLLFLIPHMKQSYPDFFF